MGNTIHGVGELSAIRDYARMHYIAEFKRDKEPKSKTSENKRKKPHLLVKSRFLVQLSTEGSSV